MKQLQSILLLACIVIVMHVYAEEQIDLNKDENISSVVTSEPAIVVISQPAAIILSDNAIAFKTEDENHPIGEYCPIVVVIIGPDGTPINNASAYIGDNSYSDVVEEKTLLPHQATHYLGYFTNDKEEIIHLYGIKDKTSPNDAIEETITNGDLIDANDDDDNESL